MVAGLPELALLLLGGHLDHARLVDDARRPGGDRGERELETELLRRKGSINQ